MYSCPVCIAKNNKHYEARECFLQPWKKSAARAKKLRLPVPRFRRDGELRRTKNGKPLFVNEWMDRDGFMDALAVIQAQAPHLNIWQIHQTFFKTVCPRAFFDSVMDRLLAAEATVVEYKGAVGSLTEQETRENLLGFDIPYDDLISAFEIVRSAKNEFKRMEHEEAEARINKGTATKGSGRAPRKVTGDS